jgi:hypothetical protein
MFGDLTGEFKQPAENPTDDRARIDRSRTSFSIDSLGHKSRRRSGSKASSAGCLMLLFWIKGAYAVWEGGQYRCYNPAGNHSYRENWMTQSEQEGTQLLARVREGDREASDRLKPSVYDELRRLALRYIKRQADGQTLQTTALVRSID